MPSARGAPARTMRQETREARVHRVVRTCCVETFENEIFSFQRSRDRTHPIDYSGFYGFSDPDAWLRVA